MSAIQLVCAVVVPLLWGYQFVAIKVGVTEFPPLWLIARCSMGRVAPFGLLLPVFALISSDCRWADRDFRRRQHTSKTERSTNLNPEVASCHFCFLALLRNAIEV